MNDNKKIIAAEKSLTTRFDLSVGIGDVVGRLPGEMLSDIIMVSLSTTLTTNSVVEDQGAPVAVLLPGYNEAQVKQSGLLEILPAQLVVIMDGGFDAVALVQHCQRKGIKVTLVSRLRLIPTDYTQLMMRFMPGILS